MYNKNATIRYRELDRCFRKGNMTMKQILDRVNRVLEDQGIRPVQSPQTIHNDIEAMMGQSDVIIKYRKIGRNRVWGYTDPSMSFYKIPFTDDQMAQLAQCMAILKRFDGIPQMDWISDFSEQFKAYLNMDRDRGRMIVGFDECKYLRGREHFAYLYNAITTHRVLNIGYKSFTSGQTRQHIFHPYYIKEYNKRWFVVGLKEGKTGYMTLAFDRIETLDVCPGVEYKPLPEGFDFEEDYYSDIIGVSRFEGELVAVKIWVSPDRAPYVKTKPFHPSQIINHEDEDGLVVTIKVLPNVELIQTLLAMGTGVKVLEPAEIADWMVAVLYDTLLLYEDPEDQRR